tara:strand:- start:2252 stop:3739 length:1488 start_codon:yes stop_codon:yes gene_type:complete
MGEKMNALHPLARLRTKYVAPPISRILIHRGTAGDAVGVSEYGDRIRRILEGKSHLVVDVCSDGANWAAPSATVAQGTFMRRFERLDLNGVDELIECFHGNCGDAARYAGTGEKGITSRMGRNDGSLGDVLSQGAYTALDRVLQLSPEEVINRLSEIGLTGRGGAHFPVAQKWRFARTHSDQQKILVVNAEEGEPGVFKDRHMLEGDPHRLLEGVLIAHHAVGFDAVYIYVNGQARQAQLSLEKALSDAGEAGIISGECWDRNFQLTINIRSGAGGYVCGEESVILNSIEGKRPVPRYKPPFATDVGLFGKPTVINNVETLCAVTTLFDNPPLQTKLISLSGDIPRAGLYEVPVDGAMTWSGMIANAGRNPQEIKALLVGGPSGEFIHFQQFDDVLEMSKLGAGGVVVLNSNADIQHITNSLAAYNKRESCGECTPCREGSERLTALLENTQGNEKKIYELVEIMTESSLCQLGGMAGRPVLSALEQFKHEFDNS